MKLYVLLSLFGLVFAKHTYIDMGNNVTDPTKWPWMGLIRDIYGRPKCGISLISSTWGLTSAECTLYWETNKPDIMFGSHDPKSKSVVVKYKRSIRHEDYEDDKNDIALVEFDEVKGTNIAAVPLSPAGRNHTIYPDCWITGFGARGRTGNPAFWLQEGQTIVITNKECKYWWRDEINDGNVCNSDPSGAYPCFDDEGSPLVCRVDGQYELVGVASWGSGNCGGGGAAGVYSRVAYFRDWIKRNSGV